VTLRRRYRLAALLHLGLRAFRTRLSRPKSVPELRGEIGCTRACRGVERERGIHCSDKAARESAALGCEWRRTHLNRARDLLNGNAPERVSVGERLPEQHPDRPDVALRRGFAAVEALGGDVCERPRHVSDCGERVGAVELREPEVEEADGELITILDEDVRGLH